MIGRFAPTPSGRLHLGNLLCAMLSYLSAKKQGGKILLRIEDLDTYRCSWETNTRQLIDDLDFMGWQFDGGYDQESWQSARTEFYDRAYDKLARTGLLYPCTCSRAELHSATAPHLSDGSYRYDGRCYRRFLEGLPLPEGRRPATRIHLPDREIAFRDGIMGEYRENLARDCGDFIVRRADGVYAYQLAVVVDDGLSGVTEVIRGRDLISSTPRQLFLFELLGLQPPNYLHIPLLTDPNGRRLSKRDGDLDIGALRRRYASPEPIIGILAAAVGLIDRPEPVRCDDLIALYDPSKIPKSDIRLPKEIFEN